MKGGEMKESRRIHKDEEWQRLEAAALELKEAYSAAQKAADTYARSYIASQLGLVFGKTIVVYRGERYVVVNVSVDTFSPWVYGRKILKNGQRSERINTLYSYWEIEGQKI